MRSFVASGTDVPPTVPISSPAPATTAPAAPAQHALVVPRRSAFVEGDVDKSDIRTPYLGCTQAVGPKSVLFTPGTIILGETPLTTAPAPQQPTPRLRVLFVRVSKTYVENLPYNPTPGGPRARIIGTAKEVASLGGTTEWRGNTPPSFIPKTTCFTLIRCPEAFDDAQFNIIAGDKTYAPAMVSFQKTSYGAAKTLWTDLSLSLKNDPTSTFYDLFWVREQRGQNWVWVAKLVRVRDEKPNTDLVAIAAKLADGNLSVDADDTSAE